MLPSAKTMDESHDRLAPLPTPRIQVFEFYVEEDGVKTPCRLIIGWDGVAPLPYEVSSPAAHPDGHHGSAVLEAGAWSDVA